MHPSSLGPTDSVYTDSSLLPSFSHTCVCLHCSSLPFALVLLVAGGVRGLVLCFFIPEGGTHRCALTSYLHTASRNCCLSPYIMRFQRCDGGAHPSHLNHNEVEYLFLPRKFCICHLYMVWHWFVNVDCMAASERPVCSRVAMIRTYLYFNYNFLTTTIPL